jgi:hypothetical protein
MTKWGGDLIQKAYGAVVDQEKAITYTPRET